MSRPQVKQERQSQAVHDAAIRAREDLPLALIDGTMRTIGIDEIPDGVLVVDAEGRIVAVNSVIGNLFGYRDDELIGEAVELLVPERFGNHKKIRRRFQVRPHEKPMGRVQEIFGRHKEGHEIPVDMWLRPMGADGTMVCFVRDISDHVRLSDEIRKASYLDVVTGTRNRRAFNEDLDRILKTMAPESNGTGVAIFDIDHFKDINDSLGHHSGDRLLMEFCERLGEILRPDMRLYRIGGDEFALILPDCPDHVTAQEFVNTAIRFIRRPFMIEGHRIGIGCSAGIVHAPTDGKTAQDLVSNADLALYEAKSIRGTSSVFTPHLRAAVEDRFSLVSQLRAAVEEGQFELHYQPQVDIGSGAIAGAEALLRWRHPVRGLLQPGQFIEVLTNNEVSIDVGRWTLFEACQQAASWQVKADRPVRVAVNLFPWQVRTRRFFDDVREAVANAGLGAHLLELELTENTIIDSSEDFIKILTQVREQGVGVALDDFGTGFASLNSLTRFPIDTIKIDRSFVRDVGSGKGNWPILRMMPKLARDLGMTTVAEGVETAEDAMMIQHFGFDTGQGYYWGKPVPADEFVAMLQNGGSDKPSGEPREIKPVRISALEEIVKRRFPMYG
ncbi:putative bifunctional diguanylate cyclase/phosphodiesterase [Oricola thermophila]|uniref:EAL domain-containing protein n=1 Tax=Oricola thermophila TaxID=2742145 RepID=A0A6N1VGP5_9HYPH|nr:EAL domain-containing protein [Oricola thermophila]QKV18845.1 EAL domain-containing protein [Oricola thermophila]